MSQSTVILEPSSQRQSLAGALSQAGLVDWEAGQTQVGPPAPIAVDFHANSAGVFESSPPVQESWGAPGERTVPLSRSQSRQRSSWTPAGFQPEPLALLDDPQRAADLPWLKAKRKGRFRRKAKVLTAWLATLLMIGAILGGTAYLMGLYPWPKGNSDFVARQ